MTHALQELSAIIGRAARYRVLSIFTVAMTAVGLRLCLWPVLGCPEPRAHDEFSYLLGADTLASGRLVNPQHPLWRFFETPHVLVTPFYASKYPPAQALFLAVRQVLFGNPFFGVLLSLALLILATGFMLHAWVRPPWALFGTILTAISFGAGHYWTESYWGGTGAALGAALLLAGYRWMRLRKRPWYGVAAGTGVLLLVNSRPYEGGLLIAAVLVPFTVFAVRYSRRTGARHALRLIAPFLGAVAVAAGLTVGYNRAVTGSLAVMPYRMHQQQYAVSPAFWPMRLTPRKPHPNLEIDKQYAGWESEQYKDIRELPLFKRIPLLLIRLIVVLRIGWAGLAMLPLLFVPLVRRTAKARELTWFTAAIAAGLLLEVWMFPHYMAPLIVVLVVLACIALAGLSRSRLHPPGSGRIIAAIAAILALLPGAVRTAQAAAGIVHFPYGNETFSRERARILSQLLSRSGDHVVFVHYLPDHEVSENWVVNKADIDRARIVWANDLGTEEDKTLMSRYPHRTAWLLEPDLPAVRLSRIVVPVR